MSLDRGSRSLPPCGRHHIGGRGIASHNLPCHSLPDFDGEAIGPKIDPPFCHSTHKWRLEDRHQWADDCEGEDIAVGLDWRLLREYFYGFTVFSSPYE